MAQGDDHPSYATTRTRRQGAARPRGVDEVADAYDDVGEGLPARRPVAPLADQLPGVCLLRRRALGRAAASPSRYVCSTWSSCRTRASDVRTWGGLAAATFQTQVVVGADSGEQGDFLTVQTGHPPVTPGREPRPLRGDQRTPGPKLAAEPVAGVLVLHADTVTRCA
jgi:hypothetical protein